MSENLGVQALPPSSGPLQPRNGDYAMLGGEKPVADANKGPKPDSSDIKALQRRLAAAETRVTELESEKEALEAQVQALTESNADIEWLLTSGGPAPKLGAGDMHVLSAQHLTAHNQELEAHVEPLTQQLNIANKVQDLLSEASDVCVSSVQYGKVDVLGVSGNNVDVRLSITVEFAHSIIIVKPLNIDLRLSLEGIQAQKAAPADTAVALQHANSALLLRRSAEEDKEVVGLPMVTSLGRSHAVDEEVSSFVLSQN